LSTAVVPSISRIYADTFQVLSFKT
jgi:hypothetical protein